MPSRKFLLFSRTDLRIKKDDEKDRNVTMSKFDGEEICEVVGLYILHKLDDKYGKERINLYMDDGLACLEITSGSEVERRRKAFIKSFKMDSILTLLVKQISKPSTF